MQVRSFQRVVLTFFMGVLALAFAGTAFAQQQSTDVFTQALQAHGWAAALPTAFLVGLLTAGTPCVYPMIAITVSVFGARKETRGRAALISTAFVHGIAVLLVPVGVLAALSGRLSGSAAGHPAVQIGIALLMFAMALSMFGLFDVSLPGSIQNRLATMGGVGIKGAFVIGMATGPIAAPCASPGLAGIISYTYQSQNAAMGALALYAYALGLGLPFWIVGTFGMSLPKPGFWMVAIKNFMGVVLIGVALYYLRFLVPFFRSPPISIPGSPFVFYGILIVGLAMGAIHLSFKDGTRSQRIRQGIGAVLAAFGGVWGLLYEPPLPNVIRWERDVIAARETALREHRPVLLDFGARWCAACEELATITFRDTQVARVAEENHYITVKVYEDEERPSNYTELQRRYAVRSLPTVIIFNGSGEEIVRENRFVPPNEMASLMRRAN